MNFTRYGSVHAEGKKVAEMNIEQSMKGLSEFGRWLHECKG